jgi:hypothetical protein
MTGTIWLHIGSPKTGTTSLQQFLQVNEDRLRNEAGLNYMQAGRSHVAHNEIAANARIGTTGPLFDAILAEADAQPDAQHVLSSEMLFNPHVARKLTAAIPAAMRGRTRLICYLRRQDAYLEALYKQFLKNGRIPPDRDAFLAKAPKLIRYWDVIDGYGQVLGPENVVLRPFSPTQLAGGDMVQDFTDQLGLDLPEDLDRDEGFANKTFSAEMSEALAIMGEVTEFRTRQVIRELIALQHPGTLRSRDVFSGAQRRQLMQDMAPETEKLVKTYLPDDAAFFAYDDIDTSEESASEERAQQLKDRASAMEAILKAIGNLQARHAQQTETIAEEPVSPAPEAEPEEDAPVLPTWYCEIYPAGPSNGWFHKFDDYSCSFVERSRAQLVVSFDNLSQAGNPNTAREPWAQKFCADRGYSQLGVYAQSSTWFRNADLIAHLNGLRDAGFFKRFEAVSFVGTSMGAFGAVSFSSLAPGATVVAFSPQTSLDEAKVPWEKRFAKGRAADWSLPYSDAAEHTATASKIYLIYDPFHAGDRAHVARLSGDNLIHLKGFGLGHKSALVLNRMDALKSVMEGGITGTLSEPEFYKTIRARKGIYLYRKTIEGYLEARGQTERRTRFAAAFKKYRKSLKTA